MVPVEDITDIDEQAPTPLIRIDAEDSVAIAPVDLSAGDAVAVEGGRPFAAAESIPRGHKIALRRHAQGEKVIKYGHSIGAARRPIARGEYVHEHNLASEIRGEIDYGSPPEGRPRGRDAGAPGGAAAEGTFMGYRRADGRVGIRNQLWIIPTVGCVDGVAEKLAAWGTAELGIEVLPLTHPYGCSQLGDDLSLTRRILASLARHPNAGGVLLLSLGCENNRLEDLLAAIGDRPEGTLGSMRLQDAGEEVEDGRAELKLLAERAKGAKRVEVPTSELVVGLKCGGSDAFSGVSANPATGLAADAIVAAGGSILLGEVPEMFGAEESLLGRAATAEVWRATASMINAWKAYYLSHGQGSHENPSPGNKEGGITTIEEKSSGCVRKAGGSAVRGVIDYGEMRVERGLSLVSCPGNDLVSSTALAAAGAQLILFTTGRGTPFGSIVPTIKISSTSELASRKPGWIDWDSGPALEGVPLDTLAGGLLRKVAAVASGERTKNERSGYSSIAIFKDGVTL